MNNYDKYVKADFPWKGCGWFLFGVAMICVGYLLITGQVKIF